MANGFAATASPDPVRVLFFNSRDAFGADVAVHASLAASFDRSRTAPYLISNSDSLECDDVVRRFGQMPSERVRALRLGRAGAGRGAIGKVRGMIDLAASLAAAARQARKWRIDVIHATDRPRDAMLSTVLASMAGARSVVHVHANLGPSPSKGTLLGLRRATTIFTVSDYLGGELRELGIDQRRIKTVYNSTDATYFDPARSMAGREQTRHELGIPAEAPVVCCVGRLIPWKGQRELIQAAATLRETLPDLRILLVGVGDEEEALKRLAESCGCAGRIVFAGWHDDVRPLLAASDIFALPSYAEPFGLALTEAMAMQLPVIACRSGGAPEVVSDGHDGLLVAPESSDELAEAILKLALDPKLARRLGERGRTTVIDRFSPQKQADLVSSIYGELAAGRMRNTI